MGQNGGFRPGSGRKPGSTTKRVALLREQSHAAVVRALDDGVMPLDIMCAAMRMQPLPNGEYVTREQFEMAASCAVYLHPRLSAVAVQPVPEVAPVEDRTPDVTELLRKALEPKTIEGAALISHERPLDK